MQKQIFALAIFTLFASTTLILRAADAPETRRHEAERYLQATPAKALFEDIADKMAANLPADQREQFKRMMTADLDIAALTKAMTDAMVKHFTTVS
jgi:predicted nucleic acid-binding protein